mmetsp:Transcript_10284/g.16998  ORF Transcript_10284/g.16998 Transcript_10284/m.16998 type:complete len:82 (+) Transcript_10284:54-299(+)
MLRSGTPIWANKSEAGVWGCNPQQGESEGEDPPQRGVRGAEPPDFLLGVFKSKLEGQNSFKALPTESELKELHHPLLQQIQ